MPIAWDPKLAVGVRLIDQQHQELFERVNALLAALEQSQGPQVVADLLQFLKQYVVEHFAAEQRLMTQSRYPGYVSHEAQHDAFVKSFLELEAAYQAGGATLGFTLKLNNFVCGWLRQHIGTADRALGIFLSGRATAGARP